MKKRPAKLRLYSETLHRLDASNVRGGALSLNNCTGTDTYPHSAAFTDCTYCLGGTYFTCPQPVPTEGIYFPDTNGCRYCV